MRKSSRLVSVFSHLALLFGLLVTPRAQIDGIALGL
jgi:hypothetical protein